jgi:hypothetical protein
LSLETARARKIRPSSAKKINMPMSDPSSPRLLREAASLAVTASADPVPISWWAFHHSVTKSTSDRTSARASSRRLRWSRSSRASLNARPTAPTTPVITGTSNGSTVLSVRTPVSSPPPPLRGEHTQLNPKPHYFPFAARTISCGRRRFKTGVAPG